MNEMSSHARCTALDLRAFNRAFDGVPRLSRGHVNAGSRPCKVCGGLARLFDVVDFLKIGNRETPYLYGFSGVIVRYFRCTDCEFMFTDYCEDWGREEFSRYVYNEDYALVDPDYLEARPVRVAAAMAARLRGWEGARILDYGSGMGVFAERMRGRGFAEVCCYDPFSQPVRPEGRFDIITAFEVLEHAPDPHAVFADMISFMHEESCILATTLLQPDNIEEVRANWSYAAPRNGHVSLYSLAALARIAEANGLIYCDGNGLRAFIRPRPSPVAELVLRIAGPVVRVARLGAPGSAPGNATGETDTTGWHPVERHPSGAFRWTAARRIVWRVTPPEVGPCQLRVAIPFLMEVEPEFAARSALRVGERSQPVRRGASSLIADVVAPKGWDGTLLLETPEPRSPAELGRAPDHRRLGLAIPVAA